MKRCGVTPFRGVTLTLSEVNKSDSDEQKRSSVFFRKKIESRTLSCRPGCHPTLVTPLESVAEITRA